LSKRNFKISKYTTPQSTISPPKKNYKNKIFLKKKKEKKKDTSHHGTYNGMMLGSNGDDTL
jgi:hypothetical protein